MWRGISVAAVSAFVSLVATSAVAGGSANASTTFVDSPAELARAVERAGPGETLHLADGTYPVLVLRNKQSLLVEGSRNARLAGVDVLESTDVTLRGVTVTPRDSQRAVIRVLERSSNVTIERVLVDGRDEHVGAGFDTDATVTDLTIRDGEITNCGRGERCVVPEARGMLVLRNAFHDCFDCDFIRGIGNGITIKGNSFDRAQPGACTGGPQVCPHNDHIQILAGGPWTIVGNRFGARRVGAASVFVNPGGRRVAENPIRDVRLASNVFKGDGGFFAIHIGDAKGGDLSLIQRITIVNNTILSGSAAAVLVNEGWQTADPQTRPVVANNIMSVLKESLCERARTSRNLVENGPSCANDRAGSAQLDEAGAPTASSTLVVDAGDPVYAPPTDFFDRYRNGLPDIGAIERSGFLTAPARPRIIAAAPSRVSLSSAAFRARKWRVQIRARLASAVLLRAQLVRGGRALVTRTLRVDGKKRVTVALTVPASARRPGRLSLVLRATGADGRTATRPVPVTVRP